MGLKGLKSLPGDTTGSSVPVRGAAAVTHSDDVDVSGDRSTSDKVPVFVIGGELLADVGLDEVDPLWHLHLAGLLEVGSESHGKGLLGHVLHADRGHVCFSCRSESSYIC